MNKFRNSFMVYKYQPQIVSWLLKWSTLQQHREATMLCEEITTIVKARNALSIPHSTK